MATETVEFELDNRKLKSFVRLALFSEASRAGLKRTDISRMVFDGETVSQNVYAAYFAKTNEILANEFGLELRELPKSNSSVKTYVLANRLSTMDRSAAGLQSDDSAFLGLAALTLALIYVHGSKVRDDELIVHLNAFGVPRSQHDDPPTADAPPAYSLHYEALMTKLAKQHYIVRKPVKSNTQGGGDTMPYEGGVVLMENTRGARALLELPDEQLQDMVLGLYNVERGSEEGDKLIAEMAKASEM